MSFNLESLEDAIGVSANCVNGGFKTDEAIKMMFDLGSQLGSHIISIDMCEYNPCVEDWRTGRLAVTLFYYFVLGLQKSKTLTI